MNIIKTYLYITSPVVPENIDPVTFKIMKEHNWYQDSRGSKKFQMLNKRFKIKGNWYRAMVRFERSQEDTFKLNSPIPFIVVEAETENEVVFVEKKIHHGREVKHALGYIEKGVPIELVDAVIQNLKDYIVYKNEN